MPGVMIKSTHFSGGSHLSGADAESLSAAIKGLAIDNARVKLAGLTITANTDSSGGANQVGGLAAMPVPSAATDVSSAGGVTVTALNAQLTLIADGQGRLATYLNSMATPLGLTAISEGLVAVGTIAAQAGSATGGTGSSTPTRASVQTAFTAVRNNWATIARLANQIAAALGHTARLTDGSGGVAALDMGLNAAQTVTASDDGVDGVAKTLVDAFLLASKNAVTTVHTFGDALKALTSGDLRVVAAD